VTDTNRYSEKPSALTLSFVYKLMELEQIEMDKRVAENRSKNLDLKPQVSHPEDLPS
jgi:hypothetical protein